MRRFTTPTITLTVEGIDLTNKDVYVSFKQDGRDIITVENPTSTYEDENTVLSVELTQAQTGDLKVGVANVQVNWIDNARHRNASTIGTIDVERNLLAQVIEDE